MSANIYFNHPCDPVVGLRSRKVESLQYFEICDVQVKEPMISRSTYINHYQSNWHGHLLEAEEENIVASNIVQSNHPSMRLINIIQHAASDMWS
jgi:hypothetical protein